MAIDRAIVASRAVCPATLHLLVRPELLDVSWLSGFLVCNAIPLLAAEDELVIIAFNVGRATDREWEVNRLVRRRTFVEIHNMQLLFDDVEKAQRVALLVPEWCFTQAARSLEPGLCHFDLLDVRHDQILLFEYFEMIAR